MKTKKKLIASLEIAIVLCSLFLVVLPAVAADQNMQKASANEVTTASEDDYVLDIYGNANEDDTIDMGDVVYTKLAIFGKKPKTELCDAKYDGRINVLDVIQTKLIILGKEKELTVVDSADRIVTVKKPVERVICTIPSHIEALRTCGMSKDIVIAWGERGGKLDTDFFPEFGDITSIGSSWRPDIEKIVELHPDVTFLATSHGRGVTHNVVTEKLEAAGLTVLRFRFDQPELLSDEITKNGYIFGKKGEANEFVNWYKNILNLIEERVEGISEEDKPKVHFEYSPYTVTTMDDNIIAMVGGKEIFAGTSGSVDPEALMMRNPDIIIRMVSHGRRGYGLDADDTAEIEGVREEIIRSPELQDITAVKEGHVYVLSNHLVFYMPSAGGRAFVGICYMAKWLHPELFEDLDPKAIHQEYLTRFQGLDIDLDKKGVFVYPEPS